MGVGQYWMYKQYFCIGENLRIGPPGASGADPKRNRFNIYAECTAVWRRTEAAQRFTGESTDELHTYASCSVDIVIIRGQMCSCAFVLLCECVVVRMLNNATACKRNHR